MSSVKTVWTALPSGVRRIDNHWAARISLFITPKLQPDRRDSSLGDFPAFVDWPATLRNNGEPLQFQVTLADGSVQRSTVAGPADIITPSSSAWRAIFTQDTPVHSEGSAHRKGSRDPDVASFDSAGLASEVKRAYQVATLMQAPNDGALRGEKDPLQAFRNKQRSTPQMMAANDCCVTQFLNFYQSNSNPTPRRNNSVAPLTFDQIISLISSHPVLLRKLGLVIDIDVPLTALPLDDVDPGATIYAHPIGLPESIELHSMRTAIEYRSAQSPDYRVFCAATQINGDHGYGFYRLNRKPLTQTQFEITTLSLVQHAAGENSATLPRMMQGGMRILDASIPGQVRKALGDTKQLENALLASGQFSATANAAHIIDEPVLYAEQLTRGYRIDVRDTVGDTWRSLCERSSRYSAGDWSWPKGSQRLDDEGSVEFNVFTDEHSTELKLRTLEDLFSWDGWSLAVPRPEAQAKADAGDAAPVSIDCSVRPGSLQRQRFGSEYQFRARTVDIAGNSLSMSEVNALAQSLPMQQLTTIPDTFLRVESVLPPVLFPAQTPTPGEAGDVLIIRDAESARYRTTVSRAHVFPPQISIDMAERHGMFDDKGATQSWQLIQAHQGTLDTDAAGNTRTMLPADHHATPYLPDPLATQAVLRLPDQQDVIAMPRFDDIPAHLADRELAHSCLLTIRPGKNQIIHKTVGREVTLHVPKGRSLTLTLANKPAAHTLPTLAMTNPDWLGLGDATDATFSAVLQSVEQGIAALVAPARIVEVIHASQRPLTHPVFEAPAIVARALNDTHAVLVDPTFLFDTPSTGRLDVYAAWEDVDDSAGSTGWEIVAHDIHAGGCAVEKDVGSPFAMPQRDAIKRPPLRHEFNDTRHHVVTYRAQAYSRFADYYPAALTDDPDNMTRASEPVTLHVPATAKPQPVAFAHVMPTFKHTDEQSDAREWQATQTGHGLRIYLQRGWFSSGVGEKLALVFATTSNSDDGVCAWGVNTLHDTAQLPGPLRAQHITNGQALPTDNSGTQRVVFDVQFSQQHQLPFVDIEFEAQITFMPLVRLVAARYQQHAIAGCHHSVTTQSDFVPLAVDRSVTVQKSAADSWQVTVRGYSYRQSQQTVQSVSSVIEASIQVLAMDTPEDDAAWRAAGTTVTLEVDEISAYEFQWQGAVGVTDSNWLTRHWRRRLVIREFEPFAHAGAADASLADHARLIAAHTVAL